MTKYQIREEIYNENGDFIESGERVVDDFAEAVSIYECCKAMANKFKETRTVSWYIVTDEWTSLMESETINPSKVIALN